MSIAARKWQVELCDGQESDSRPDNEPIGYSKGIKSEKVISNAASIIHSHGLTVLSHKIGNCDHNRQGRR